LKLYGHVIMKLTALFEWNGLQCPLFFVKKWNNYQYNRTEVAVVAVTFKALIGRPWIRISGGSPGLLTERIWFLLSLQKNSGIVPRLNKNSFLPDTLQFIVHRSSRNSKFSFLG
jgi:hypothetical protein